MDRRLVELKTAMNLIIDQVRDNPILDIGQHIHTLKHPISGREDPIMSLAARLIEFLGFYTPLAKPEISATYEHDMQVYRLIDTFRKIPRNLSYDRRFRGYLIDNIDSVRHGTAINILFRKLHGAEIDPYLRELNTVSARMLTIPHVVSQLIPMLVEPQDVKIAPRINTLRNFVSACCGAVKPLPDATFKIVWFERGDHSAEMLLVNGFTLLDHLVDRGVVGPFFAQLASGFHEAAAPPVHAAAAAAAAAVPEWRRAPVAAAAAASMPEWRRAPAADGPRWRVSRDTSSSWRDKT